MNLYTSCVLFVFSLLFVGCGYQFGYNGLSSQYTSISVPYVEGDIDGDLTAAIIKQVTRSGAFQYKANNGDLTLIAKIIDLSDENIGFRYYRKKDDHLTRSLIPVETRLNIIVELSVIETASGKVVLSPVKLSANMDCDHEYNSSRHEVNEFSLGQLSDYDAAFEAVRTPLNRAIAQKIVDYITESW
jgi:hypothetical protein